MLQHLGACNAAFFIDVADEDDWGIGFLGIPLESGCAFPYLGHTAWGALQLLAGDRLDRVNDDEARLKRTDAAEDVV